MRAADTAVTAEGVIGSVLPCVLHAAPTSICWKGGSETGSSGRARRAVMTTTVRGARALQSCSGMVQTETRAHTFAVAQLVCVLCVVALLDRATAPTMHNTTGNTSDDKQAPPSANGMTGQTQRSTQLSAAAARSFGTGSRQRPQRRRARGTLESAP